MENRKNGTGLGGQEGFNVPGLVLRLRKQI